METKKAEQAIERKRALEIADGLEHVTVFFPDDLALCQKALRSYAKGEGFLRRIVATVRKPKAA